MYWYEIKEQFFKMISHILINKKIDVFSFQRISKHIEFKQLNTNLK